MAVPVLLVPGIMGSRLYFSRSGKFWDPDDYWRMARWAPVWPFRSDDDNRVQLHARQPAGVVFDTADVSAAERDRGWSTVVWSYYGGLLRRLQDGAAAEGGVYAAGYDWRQDIQWLGRYLGSKIDRVRAQTGGSQVALVTHSMGGLVVRAALAARDDLADAVRVVIHVCQPSAGAVLLYRRLFTGLVRPHDGGGGVADRVFRLLMGNSRQGFLGNMSGLPGAMQLIPSEYFPPTAAGTPWHPGLAAGPHADLYPDPQSPPGLVPDYLDLSTQVLADLTDRVADVAGFHDFLGDPAEPRHPETWLIYGTGLTTETAIAFGSAGAEPVTDGEGDNTVPAVSATSLNLIPQRMIPAHGVEHATACLDGYVQELVETLVASYP